MHGDGVLPRPSTRLNSVQHQRRAWQRPLQRTKRSAAAQVPGFNDGKWIAVGDEEGFVSIIDGAAQLPKAFRPGNPDEPRPQAQWLAHHNAIFDLAWCQVGA